MKLVSAIILMACSVPAFAQFADNGFTSQSPSVRTDFINNTIGTSSSPLMVRPCIFPNSQDPKCTTPPTIYSQSNYWSQNVANKYQGWALVMNNEVSEKRDASGHPINSGPPDQSLARVLPGSGVFGFETIYGNNNFPGDTHERAHLVLDLDQGPSQLQPQQYAMPFMGLFYTSQGTFSYNNTPATLFTGNAAYPTILRWSQRLWQFAAPQQYSGSTQAATSMAYLQVIANWGTHPKFIQIHTFHYWYPASSDMFQGTNGLVYDGGWNWPYPQSFFYPGAELVELSMTGLKNLCGISLPDMKANPNVDLTYTVNLQSLFSCPAIKAAWHEPMPANTTIPVFTIGWPEEGSGYGGGLWTDVHSMGIYSAATLPATTMNAEGISEMLQPESIPNVEDGPGVAEIRSHLVRFWGKQAPNTSLSEPQ